MKHRMHNAFASALAVCLLLVASCGGKQTVASKSAEAFREAQQKGKPIGGAAGHHGGGAATDSAEQHATMTGMDHSTMTGMDHSTMTGMDHSTMTGMDHSKMSGTDHSKMTGMDHSKMTGMDHSQMQPGEQPTAGMDHSQMQHGQQPMAGMDHASMPGMQHGAAASVRPVNPPTSNAEMQAVRPASTLKGDPFDAPAPAAVSEAAKASQGGGHEGMEMRGITPGEDRENPPTPAPAIRDTPPQGTAAPPTMDHGQHGQTAPAAQPRTQSRTTSSPQARPAAATVYTCPMHPEVTSDKPGTCPKCGMTLVKK